MTLFMRDGRGGAVPWFALATFVLSVASMAGVRTLSWLSEPGRVALVASRTVEPRMARGPAAASADVDLMPTGAIPPNTLVIRLR